MKLSKLSKEIEKNKGTLIILLLAMAVIGAYVVSSQNTTYTPPEPVVVNGNTPSGTHIIYGNRLGVLISTMPEQNNCFVKWNDNGLQEWLSCSVLVKAT